MSETPKQPEPTKDEVDAVIEAEPPMQNLLSRHMHYPNAYVWLLLFSALDVMLTWVILLFNGQEVNPVARWVIDKYELTGMIVYKFSLIVFFIIICEIVGTLKENTGWVLSRISVMIATVPVFWALYLLWRHNM